MLELFSMYMEKNSEKLIELPGYRIEATDATGAGDNFLAGFVSEILRGSSDEDALRFANACGAICTTAIGAATALKDREQVDRWMKNQEARNDKEKSPIQA